MPILQYVVRQARVDGYLVRVQVPTTYNCVPLVIRVTQAERSRFNVFVRRNSAPTSTDYDWLLISRDNYTVYIPADQTSDTEHLYVGVQSSSGMLHYILHVVLLELSWVYRNLL